MPTSLNLWVWEAVRPDNCGFGSFPEMTMGLGKAHEIGLEDEGDPNLD